MKQSVYFFILMDLWFYCFIIDFHFQANKPYISLDNNLSIGISLMNSKVRVFHISLCLFMGKQS